MWKTLAREIEIVQIGKRATKTIRRIVKEIRIGQTKYNWKREIKVVEWIIRFTILHAKRFSWRPSIYEIYLTKWQRIKKNWFSEQF